MAEKKMTRAEAIEFAVETIRDHVGECEAVEVLNKMYIQIVKPRTRKPNTAKRDANVALGEKFVELWNEETFKAADVAKALEVSVPKANAICKAMDWKQVPSTEKVKVYCL